MKIFPVVGMLCVWAASASAKTVLVLPIDADSNVVKDLGTIQQLHFDAVSQNCGGNVVPAADSTTTCDEKSCAVALGKAAHADEIVYSSIRQLGSKLLYISNIVDAGGGNLFTQHMEVARVEDFENATVRMAEAICTRKSMEDVADVDNITAAEETQVQTRRNSFYYSGASLGYLWPTGNSFSRYTTHQNCDAFYNCTDDTTLQKYSQIVRLGWNNWFEFKNSLAMEIDALVFLPISIGADVNLLYLYGKSDFTPFAGGGLGIHYVFPDEAYASDNKRNSGPAVNAQAGMILFRTYGVNLVVRGQYHFIANTDEDNGFSVDVGLRKPMNTGGDDKYHHVSATTWLGMGIGVAYLIAIIIAAANSK